MERINFLSKKDLALAAANAGLVATFIPGLAEAQSQCRGQLRVESANYIDMYRFNGLGRPGKIDQQIDLQIGAAVNSTVEVLYGPRQEVIGSGLILRDGDLGRTKIDFTKPCNTKGPDGNGALKIGIHTSQNPSDVEEAIIPNNQWLSYLFGRELKNDDAIKEAVKRFAASDPGRQQIEEYFRRQSQPVQPANVPAVINIPEVVVRVENPSQPLPQPLKIEGGDWPIKKAEDFWFLPFSILAGLLGAGALIGLGAAYRGRWNGGPVPEIPNHNHQHTHNVNGQTGPTRPDGRPAPTPEPRRPRPTTPPSATPAATGPARGRRNQPNPPNTN